MKFIKRLNGLLFISFIFFMLLFTIGEGTKISVYKVASDSMKEVLNVGDLVFIKNDVDVSDFKENDIIVFYRGEKKIIHYVDSINNGIIRTKFIKDIDQNGNIVPGYDEDKITNSNLVGKYVFKITMSGFFAIMLVFTNVAYITNTEEKKKLMFESFSQVKI